jgi:hypothetical protein
MSYYWKELKMRSGKLTRLALVGILSGVGGMAEGASIIRVKKDATGTPVDGSTWDRAHRDLRSAIDAATSGDEIWVFAGTYLPTDPVGAPGNTDRTKSFALKSGVAIYGGFDQTSDSSVSDRDSDPETNQTILSGDLGETVLDGTPDGDNSYHVVTAVDTAEGTILDGFTIQAGHALTVTTPVVLLDGGGIYINRSHLDVLNCRIRNNWAGAGGGVYIDDDGGSSAVKFVDCLFEGNWAKDTGGAILQKQGTLSVQRCRFLGNGAPGYDDSTDYGGAIHATGSTGSLSIDNSFFKGNRSRHEGAAIFCGTGTGEVTNCTIVENTGRRYDEGYIYAEGAGLYGSATMEVYNSIFWDNNPENDNPSSSTLAWQITLGTGSVVKNSCIMDDQIGSSVPFGGSSNRNIDTDPEFVGSGDYRLQQSSDCVDAGRSEDTASLDLLRQPREVRCYVDMGAYEEQTTQSGACCVGESCSEVDHACECVAYVCNVNVVQDGNHGFGSCGIDSGGCCFGDADGNGVVNMADRGIIATSYSTTDPVLLCLYDLDGNGVVNPADRSVVSANVSQCNPLPDYQDGSGNNSAMNGGEYDQRFPGDFTQGEDCGSVSCP